MDSMDKFIALMLSALGESVASSFAEIINQYPPMLRPAVIGQIEAFVAGIRATFSDKENELADSIRGMSHIVTIVRDHPEEGKEAEDG